MNIFYCYLILSGMLLMASPLFSQPAATFRDGYVITKYGDTLRGKIKNTSAEEVVFMDSQKTRRSFTPYELKGFTRCGMEYSSVAAPGDTGRIFIAKLLSGAIDLYGTIYPENYNGAAVGGLMGGALGGLAGAAIGGAAGASGSGLRDSGCADDRYSIGTFYLRKGPADALHKVPNGRKKFNEFMIPLMKDHLEVVREIPEDLFFSGNTISIVRQYNAAAK